MADAEFQIVKTWRNVVDPEPAVFVNVTSKPTGGGA